MASKRIVSVEFYRGMAAVVVLLYHFMLAFMPQWIFVLPGSPIYLFFNGNAAVVFFFVLSGSVNSRSLLRDGSGKALLRALVRRWPRLMMPSLLASLFAWALFALGLYHYEAAGALSGSKWLSDFANAGHAADFHPSLVDAVLQGAALVFVTQHSDYDPVLWTMHVELMGSVMVLVLAFLMARLTLVRGLAVAGAAAAVLAMVPPHYGLPFAVGLMLTFTIQRWGKEHRPGGSAMAGLFALSLYLFMYDKPVGLHAIFHEPDSWFWMETQRILIQSVGAAGIMYAALEWPRMAESLSGGWAAWMGEMALPVFLVHAPVYCSLASWVFLRFEPRFGHGIAAGLALLAGVAGTLPVAWVFMRIDRTWGRLVNRLSDAVLARLAGPIRQPAA